jgi:type IV secretory pathway protease TraF
VCAEGETISIDGSDVAARIERDLDGRTLPTWSGCRRLAVGELFLLGDTVDSFDGRYWGPVTMNLIEGVWIPI